ncbi:hypothetical protein B7P43_G09925, partial [Cryptotermes secundus]
LLFFYGEELLAPCPAPKLEDHPLSAVRDCLFNIFSATPHMEILLRDFNAKVRREDIFEPKIGSKSLHEISNDDGVRVENFVTSRNLTVKSTMFPHRNIHKFTWTSPDEKIHNQIDHILIDRRRH